MPEASRFEDSVMAAFAEPAVGGRSVELTSATTVFEQGQAADHVYFIQRGQVRLYQQSGDERRLLEILGPGQWFDSAALSGTPTHAAKAVAIGKTTLTQTPVEGLLDAVARSPQAAVQLIRQLADRVQAAREDAAGLVFEDCNQRLVKTLVRFSRSAAATPHDDGVVLHLTHEQLAEAVGVARETVSLALTEMRLKNLVRTRRNQLTFDPAALERFASGCGKLRVSQQPRPAEIAA